MSVGVLAANREWAQVPDGYASLVEQLLRAPGVDPDRSVLVDEAGAVWSRPGFDTILSQSRLGFTPFDYQLATMQTVLRRMRGRAILADEVGLGKTIEAGLVLSELRMRGLADRALVITPAGLVDQWREELERKFGLPTTIAARGGWEEGDDRPVVLASLAAARRDPLRSAVLDQRWDAVIVDEAHRLRNPTSASGKLARALRARYLLLLTATPVENRLADLYELVNLVAPGLLGTIAQFRRTHGTADTEVGALRNVAALRERTRQIMVRHRRSEVAVLLPQRLAETVLVSPCADEQAVYTELTTRIRERGPRRRPEQAPGTAQPHPARRLQPGGRRTHARQDRLAGSGRTRPGDPAAPQVRRAARPAAHPRRARREGAGVHRVPAHPRRAGRRGRCGGHAGGRLPRQPLAPRERRRGRLPSPVTCRCCCPPSPQARAATSSSATL